MAPEARANRARIGALGAARPLQIRRGVARP